MTTAVEEGLHSAIFSLGHLFGMLANVGIAILIFLIVFLALQFVVMTVSVIIYLCVSRRSTVSNVFTRIGTFLTFAVAVAVSFGSIGLDIQDLLVSLAIFSFAINSTIAPSFQHLVAGVVLLLGHYSIGINSRIRYNGREYIVHDLTWFRVILRPTDTRSTDILTSVPNEALVNGVYEILLM